jgi:CHAT domain-containing protein
VDHQLVNGESIDARARREAKASSALPAEIAALSKLLLDPLAGKLNTKRLLIVPDGALQYIPFQVLLDPESHAPLIRNHEIVNQPSASTLALVLAKVGARKPASNVVAVLADPVFELNDPRVTRESTQSLVQPTEMLAVRRALRDVGVTRDGLQIPRLFASGREANEIMALAPVRGSLKAVGFAATRARVFSAELANYRIVHIATHGVINNERPEESGIVLSLVDQQGRSQDGFLRLQDIYSLKLPADLVVLSACSTALGKDVRGEGLIGITRGFMYAGAAGVVASLWKVDDEATAELMKHFYAALFEKGMPPAAALRDAQLELAKHSRWQSPYYWAGFVIQGQYDQK